MNDAIRKSYNDLVDTLITYTDLYEIGETIVPDQVFDTMLSTVAGVEAEFPDWTRPDSPTQRVGYGSLSRGRTPHAVQMWSLANIYTPDELEKFLRRTKRSTYSVEPKYDGVSLEIVYIRGKFTLATTRGDGTYGSNVSATVSKMQGIPHSIPCPDNIKVFHGEVVVSIANLKVINEILKGQGKKTYTSARSAAAGILQSDNAFSTYLEFIVWDVPCVNNAFSDYDDDHDTKLGRAHRWKVGTVKPPVAVDFIHVAGAVEQGMMARERSKYELDGFVIKINDQFERLSYDYTRKSPTWAIAYKFEAAKAITEVEDIIFQVSAAGNLNPVAVLKPVFINDFKVSRVNLFNMAHLKLMNMWIGDTVEVSRVADVNNQITKVLHDKRSVDATPPVFPTHCPSCGSELEESGFRKPVLKCMNSFGCKSQVLKRISQYTSASGVSIRMHPLIMEKLYDLGLVTSIPDLYAITEKDLIGLGMSEGMAVDRMIEIKAARKYPASVHLSGLSIPGISFSTAALLMRDYTFSGMVERLQDGDDFSTLIGDSANKWLQQYIWSEDGEDLLIKMARVLEQ